MSAPWLLWSAPLPPLAAFAVLAAGLARFGRLATGLATLAISGSVAASALLLIAAGGDERTRVSLPWLVVGGRRLEIALGLDPLGALAALLVSVVSLVVFVYAASYMKEDPHRGRFFAELSLFSGSMLALVLAADLVTLFIAWELIGLCSYLLIGFWFERPGVPAAATKAFLVTRTGDLALLAGILLLIAGVGSSRIDVALSEVQGGGLDTGLLLLIALLVFAGAAAKSAQMPFQGWLPDAMVGPTPVSALLHSATMVAAGVFLVARLYPLFLSTPAALSVMAWVGAATALLGGGAALVERDLKRTLAYSTMSQLGLMFVGLGAGSLLAGTLLLIAQALYKALLFLAAGAIDHAVGGTEYDRMGGLARRLPGTFAGFAIGAAALAGLPITLALPPKDPVLAAAWGANAGLFAAALLASLLTALYSARMLGLVFLGPASRAALAEKRAEPGLIIPMLTLAAIVPLGLLADAAIFGRPLGRLLSAATPEAPAATALALGVALFGVAAGLLAGRAWPAAVVWPPLRSAAPLLAGEFGSRALYHGVARIGIRFTQAVGGFDRRVFDPLGVRLAAALLGAVRCASTLDRAVFDAVAHRVAASALSAIRAGGRFDASRVDAAVRAFGHSLLGGGERLRSVQTGRVENYLLAVFFWTLAMIVLAAVALSLR